MAEIFTEARLQEALDAILAMDASKEAKKARLAEVRALWDAAKEARRVAAIGKLRENSLALLAAMDGVLGRMEALQSRAGLLSGATVAAARREMAALHAAFHDAEGLRRTFGAGPETLEVTNDEAETPAPEPGAPPALPAAGPALETPTPLAGTRYVALADEYVRFWLGAELRPTHAAKVEGLADAVLAKRPRYEAAVAGTKVPWWFVAGVHLLESTMNFGTHLHNGDPLTGRTFRVPSGRPAAAPAAGGDYRWEESAADALAGQSLVGLSDWSLPRALWRWERYNGFGYRKRGVPTPYLWSFSSIYLRGKYVADGRFDGSATSAQCGAAVLLKELVRRGEAEVALDVVAETEEALVPIVAAVPSAIRSVGDDVAAESHPFSGFFADMLPGLAHFSWREFLHKGGSPLAAELNDDPPEDLWPNVLPLARMLDLFRKSVGAPVRLHSIYRSPAYNARLEGTATRSQHMAFRAADVSVGGDNPGKPGEWAAKLAALRASDPAFMGGIGIYDSFVHVDVRGVEANWDSRRR